MKDLITTLGAVNISTNYTNKVDSSSLDTNVNNILNAIIGALGIVAVIVIIIGGVTYMTSGGDAGKVKTAKNTILYGVIGLVICVLAFAIVNFVISNIIGNANN